MALYKRGKTWHTDFSVNGQRFRQSLDTSDWREAQSKEKELIAQASAGKLAPASKQFSKLTITEAIERYLADRSAHVQPISKRSESDHAKPLRDYFGCLPLARIDADSILAYVTQRKANDLSNTTVNMEIGILRRILKRAKRWHFVEDEVPRLPERRDIGRALQPVEKLRLLKVAQSRPEWETAYLASVLALNTTMRGCEVKQLRWRDIDFMDHSLVIRRSKTRAGERLIPLNANAYNAIMRLRERAQMLFGSDLQPDWYVFPSAEGYSKPDPTKPMSGWRSAWRSLTRAVKCPTCGELQNPSAMCCNAKCGADISKVKSSTAGLRFHDLRHHAITELAESQASDRTIMSIAGHVCSEENESSSEAAEKPASTMLAEAPASTSVPDFVNTYTSYADVYELPAEVHEAMALGLLAAAANGNVWIESGDKRLSLDCWFLITTGSGGGRNTAIRKAREILQAAELDGLVRNISWGSEPIVKQHFAENPHGVYVWPEMSEKLQDLGRSQFAGVKPWITDLYDETTPPPSKIYRKIPNREGTPPIEFKVAPRTTFIATSSFEWLMQNLTRVDSTGGFLARWMHVRSSQKNKHIPIPKPSDKQLIPVLAKRLREVAELEGTADLSAVKKMYVDWYEKTAKRFEQQPNQDIAQAYWNRHRDQVLKLAVLFEMSSSGSLKVSPESMKRAMAYAFRIENSLFKIISTGFDSEGYELARMTDFVRKMGAPGVTLSDFTREFKNMDAGLRLKRLGTLLEGKDLYRFSRPTPGRTAHILVHRDYFEAYKKDHPADTEKPWERP